MANIIIRPEWYIPENRVTPEKSYFNRRSFLKQMGFAGSGALTMKSLDGFGATKARRKLFPAKRNGNFSPPWRLTDETWATHYNNFYEFSTQKTAVVGLVGDFKIDPWQIKIHGLCDKPLTIDARDLAEKIGLEERVYRFRCVEAWSMVVPWTGFPLNKVLRMVKPKAEAKFVKFITAMKPAEMPGINYLRGYPWPYTEGLRLDEAMNDLALVTTGMYGNPSPSRMARRFA